MQFLLIICHDNKFRPTESLICDIHAWIKEMSKREIRIYGNPLRPSGDAVTVRVRRGKLQRSKGPISRSAEKVSAYELIECTGMEEAIDAASRHPMAKAGSIEIRPVWSEMVG